MKNRDIKTIVRKTDQYNSFILNIASNQDSWEDCKNIKEEFPLYIDIEQMNRKVWVGLTLDEMRTIRNYLNDKIEYLDNTNAERRYANGSSRSCYCHLR